MATVTRPTRRRSERRTDPRGAVLGRATSNVLTADRRNGTDDRRLRIAIIGTRGVPATFGGIERHVEEVASRLAARGHDVTVFCRRNYVEDRPRSHRGIRLRHLPTVPSKHLDAIAHSALAATAASLAGFDIVHFHAVGPGLVSPIAKYFGGARVVHTIHGLDGDRAKWGRVARNVLSAGTWVSAHVPDATVVVSEDLARHYREQYGRDTVRITNGVVPPVEREPGPTLDRLGLRAGGYALFVGRLVPEKAPDLLLRAFARVRGDDLRLVIAGGSSFTDEYVATIEGLAAEDERVLLPGYVYGSDLEELYSNAGAFVLPSFLEGLPLTLLEAASYGVPVVASDIAPHREVMGVDRPGARLFAAGDDTALARALTATLGDPVRSRAGAADLRAQVLAAHDWDVVTDELEALYRRVVERRQPVPAVAVT